MQGNPFYLPNLLPLLFATTGRFYTLFQCLLLSLHFLLHPLLKLQQQMDSLLDMYLQIPGNILFLARHA
ncbi:hypothetical protein M431DRAFT_355214 [Trichoderma harzianum CBS 226.95]|uniref:Uncharacterized protein n=1 Tax=Trichoderma harzianum CBS 226.95 TaxID=983964 RepID=A0A2T4AM72_TRIHA|nr:hypothetical protein M431DRAFT_355214 [Trichoderma harzianum CBS 226.95]PTB57998.1 hypothetical protein M431DRAFT_355214 [Trichoderma harzianum CBS 226.95]